jgi:hypothetical protein
VKFTILRAAAWNVSRLLTFRSEAKSVGCFKGRVAVTVLQSLFLIISCHISEERFTESLEVGSLAYYIYAQELHGMPRARAQRVYYTLRPWYQRRDAYHVSAYILWKVRKI